MYNKKIFSEHLKELRSKSGKTQKQFAEFVGSTPATISAYENGAKNPSLELVSSIAACCNVSLDWLCGLSDKKGQKKSILTYSDSLNLFYDFMEAARAHGLDIKINFDTVSFFSKIFIEITDSGVLSDAIKEFKAIYDLYAANTITKEMYDTLFESLSNKYNKQITDEGLPF